MCFIQYQPHTMVHSPSILSPDNSPSKTALPVRVQTVLHKLSSSSLSLESGLRIVLVIARNLFPPYILGCPVEDGVVLFGDELLQNILLS